VIEMAGQLVAVRGLLVDGLAGIRPGTAVCQAGRIAAVAGPDWQGEPTAQSFDFDDCFVLPGLLDLQVNGAGGRDVMEGTAEALAVVAQTVAGQGTTAFLPTVTTNTADAITNALAMIAGCAGPRSNGATILGSHLEGPYLNPAYRGAHLPEQVRKPDPAEFDRFLAAAAGTLRLLTLAPEQEGALAVIKQAREAGVTVSVGHSAAEGEAYAAGRWAGVTMATHLFNAMLPLHHRRPGLVGAILADEGIRPGLIADGIHVAPTVAALAARLIGPERLVLVSDAMSALGLPDGRYEIAGGTAEVAGGAPRRPDGTLAGATTPLLTCLRNLMAWTGWPLATAARTATLNPAEAIGVEDRYGRLAPGYAADLLVIDSDWQVQLVVAGGRVVVGGSTS
jgi:N-acetylglucosamine-6-phosphate deacetylase